MERLDIPASHLILQASSSYRFRPYGRYPDLAYTSKLCICSTALVRLLYHPIGLECVPGRATVPPRVAPQKPRSANQPSIQLDVQISQVNLVALRGFSVNQYPRSSRHTPPSPHPVPAISAARQQFFPVPCGCGSTLLTLRGNFREFSLNVVHVHSLRTVPRNGVESVAWTP